MRPRVSWMVEADNRILEFFEDHQIAMPPSVLTYELDYSRPHITTRMKILSNQGLLEDIEEVRGLYRITQRGLDYLHGELEAEDLELHD